jgi:hypothetical protein
VVVLEDYWTLQDNTYVALFDKVDGQFIKERLALARQFKDSKFLEGIHDSIHRRWEGKFIKEDLEPLEVQYKRDKVTMEGMEIFNRNIMLQATISLAYMAVGSGAAQTYANQQLLQSEVARANMLNDGFMNAEGLFLMWDDVFDILVPSFACSEIGIFDSAVGGTMAARAVLGQAVNHDYGNDYLYVQFFIATMSS